MFETLKTIKILKYVNCFNTAHKNDDYMFNLVLKKCFVYTFENG